MTCRLIFEVYVILYKRVLSLFQPNSDPDEYENYHVITIGYGNLENNEVNEKKQLRQLSIKSYSQR